MSDGWTQADADNVRAAIREIAIRGVASLSINGRQITYSNINQLRELLSEIEGSLVADTHGGAVAVQFDEIS